MSDSKADSIAIIKRAAMQRQQLEARIEASDRERARWPFRLKRAVTNAFLCFVFVFFFFLLEGVPTYFPQDLDALMYLAIASISIVMVFGAAAIAEEWIEAQTKWVTFWRVLARVVFLSACLGLFFGAYRTADIWVPHFQ
ncbi:MAG: hypothetical protein JNN20_15460 [Betaproteobacteria bacterium]|nr:hypothetical protein [Betaproteobacteria bacterium]